jgi:hypothetical protein
MSHIEFYPYRTRSDGLVLSCESNEADVIVEERRVLMQNVPDDAEVTLRLRVVEVDDPVAAVLPDYEREDPPLETIVAARSLGSRFRRSVALTKDGDDAWIGELKLERRDVFGTIELEPLMVRTRPGQENGGFAGHVGARVAWGQIVVAQLDDPPTSSGENLEIKWDDFAKTSNAWRAEHPDALYLLEMDEETPVLWLNEAIPHFKVVAHSRGRRGREMRVRNAVFATIASQVWTSLLSAVATNLARLTQEDPEGGSAQALETLSEWETRVLHHWASILFSDSGGNDEAIEELIKAAGSPQGHDQLQQLLVPHVLAAADATRSFAGLIRLRDMEGV